MYVNVLIEFDGPSHRLGRNQVSDGLLLAVGMRHSVIY